MRMLTRGCVVGCFLLIVPLGGWSDVEDIPENLKVSYGGVDLVLEDLQLRYSYDPTHYAERPPKLEWNIRCKVPAEQKMTLYNRAGKIKHIVYDDGSEPAAEDVSAVAEKATLGKIRRGSFMVELNAPLPPREVKRIKILEGFISIYSQEPDRRSVFLPLTDTNHSEFVAAGAFRIKLQDFYDRTTHKSFKFAAESIGKTDLKQHNYYQWELVLKNAKTYERPNSWGSGDNAENPTFHVTFSCPEKLEDIKGISVSWYDDLGGNKLDVPFVFRDVPLP